MTSYRALMEKFPVKTPFGACSRCAGEMQRMIVKANDRPEIGIGFGRNSFAEFLFRLIVVD
jgi:hypothetical protein